MATKENDDTEDGEGQLQGQSKGGIYREEIWRGWSCTHSDIIDAR